MLTYLRLGVSGHWLELVVLAAVLYVLVKLAWRGVRR